MKRWILFGITLLLVSATSPAFAAGLIIVHDSDFWDGQRPIVPPPFPPPIPPPRPFPPPPRPEPLPPPHYLPPPRPVSPIEIRYEHIQTHIKDQIAVTSVEEEFYNPNDRRLEGTFLFPVPKGAQINKFSMEIGGKHVEAELMPADKARRIYEDIVRKLKDPALLEYAGRDLFRARIFPIEPHSPKQIKLSYTQLLKSDAGLISYVLPLNTEKFSAKPLKNLSLKIDLESKRPLKALYSPSHQVEIRRDGKQKATVGFEAAEVRPDADFQFYYSQEEGDVSLNLMTCKNSNEDGYFLLLASPGVDADKKELIAKDVAFVLDTSGSMAGAKLDQAKKALQFCVENLNDIDRFEIIRFSTETESLFDRLVAGSKENRSRANDFIKNLKPIGGTAIDDALHKALALRPEKTERPFAVIFLTDGRPTVGTTDEEQIVANATKSSGGNTRVFCFGIGTDVNTHLLDKITENTRAVSQYVLPDEDLEVKVSNFFTKIKEPVLANVRISFPEGAHITGLYPTQLPDLFKGEQLILAGRYSGKATGKITIEGNVNGVQKKFDCDSSFPSEASDHDFIPRLWATRRVGYLLDEIRLHGENQELRDEVVDLARKYAIVTPYTAYLILEDEDRRHVAQSVRSFNAFSGSEERLQTKALYLGLREEKSGDVATLSSRYGLALKSADNAVDGLSQGNKELARMYLAPAAPAGAAGTRARQSTFSYGGLGGGAGPQATAGGVATGQQLAVQTKVAEQVQQSRYVNGRTFFQNGNQWVDATVQKAAKDAKHIRVKFNSQEYFDLIAKESNVRPWLALGKNVQFLAGETVYEIYE
jgi:Ca-activated chloride channel family protein